MNVRLFHKIFQITILSSLAAGIVAGCTKSKYYDRKETIVIGLEQNPKTLDPRTATDAIGQRLDALLFDSLVQIGSGLKITGDAASRWDYKNKQYTFYLHPGLTFSDGAPLTKDDVLFTFAEYMKPSSPFKSAFNLIEKVDADFSGNIPTVTIQMKSFSASFLVDLALVRLLPKKDVEKYGDTFNKHLNGTGAYKVVSRNLGELILEKRDGHPVYQPKVKYLQFKIIQDDSTRFLNAYKGSLDIIQSALPLNKISYLEKQNKYQIFNHPGTSMNYILLNFKNPIFQNKDLRWALSKALDRDAIIKYKLEGFATSATSLLPGSNSFHNEDLQPIKQDLKAAKAIVEKLKLSDKEFVLKTSNNPEVVDFSRVIASQLAEIGFHVRLQSFEWGTFYGDIKSGNYEMAIMRWVGLSDPDIYRTAFSSKEFPPGRNRSFYSNKDLDVQLDEGQGIEDYNKRKILYNKIQKTIFDEQIIIPLWYNALVDLVHKRLSGYVPPENGDFSPLYNMSINVE